MGIRVRCQEPVFFTDRQRQLILVSNDGHECGPLVVPIHRQQKKGRKKRATEGYSLIPHSTINRPNVILLRIIDLPPQKPPAISRDVIETPLSFRQVMSRPSRENNGDVIQPSSDSHRLVTFADQSHVPRDLLLRELVHIPNVSVPSDRPRRDRVETIEPDLHKFWVPVRVTRRGPPMRRDYSIEVHFRTLLRNGRKNNSRFHATDLLPSGIRRQGGSCLCKKRLNERDRVYGESPQTQSLARTATISIGRRAVTGRKHDSTPQRDDGLSFLS